MSPNRIARIAALVTAALLCTACAGQTVQGDRSLTGNRGLGVVTTAEIEASGTHNALDAVRRLRPELLAKRNDAAASDPYRGYPVVYLNGVLQGGVDALENIPSAVVSEIRYVGSTAAADRFGVRHPGGAIVVSTRRL